MNESLMECIREEIAWIRANGPIDRVETGSSEITTYDKHDRSASLKNLISAYQLLEKIVPAEVANDLALKSIRSSL